VDRALEVNERLDRIFERRRQRLGQGADPDMVYVVQKGAAQTHDREGLAGRMKRHFHRDFLARLQLEEIDVEQAACSRIQLEAVNHHPMDVFAIDLELNDRVRVSRPADMVELVGIQRDGDRVDAVTENDRWDFACPAQESDMLADLCPAGRG
jgi:hypothetical protein